MASKVQPPVGQVQSGNVFQQIDNNLLKRANERLSEIIPKRLRFSEVLAQKQNCLAAKTAVHASSKLLKVFVRIRPAACRTTVNQNTEVVVTAHSNTVLHINPPAHAKGRTVKAGDHEHYTFTRVLHGSCTQQEVFAETAAQLVNNLVEFKTVNNVFMAYGSSGAGKTYTLEGTTEQPGIIPLSLGALFEVLSAASNSKQVAVMLSCYEVYNEVVYDLLKTTQPGRLREVLKVRENVRNQVCIPGLCEVCCNSIGEALDVQRKASRNRQQATTGINTASSRSHSVLTIRLAKLSGTASLEHGKEQTCSLSFVDLAGSERMSRTGNAGDRLRESASINSSLMTLGRCLEALKHNQTNPTASQKVIPVRESKITHIFKDVLQGSGNLVLLVSVSPLAEDYEETHHMLKYAALACRIHMASTVLPCQPGQQPRQDASQPLEIENSLLRARNTELEQYARELEEQLQQTTDALYQAEAEIREEVVAELQTIIAGARSEYEEQVEKLAAELDSKEQQVAQLHQQNLRLQEQLASEQAKCKQPHASANPGHNPGKAKRAKRSSDALEDSSEADTLGQQRVPPTKKRRAKRQE